MLDALLLSSLAFSWLVAMAKGWSAFAWTASRMLAAAWSLNNSSAAGASDMVEQLSALSDSFISVSLGEGAGAAVVAAVAAAAFSTCAFLETRKSSAASLGRLLKRHFAVFLNLRSRLENALSEKMEAPMQIWALLCDLTKFMRLLLKRTKRTFSDGPSGHRMSASASAQAEEGWRTPPWSPGAEL